MTDYIPGGVRTIAFALTLAGAIGLGHAVIPLLRRLKIGQTIRADGPATHLAKSGVPTMGGVIFIVPAAVILAALSVWDHRILPQILVTAGMGAVGFVDDMLKVRRKSKDGLTPVQKTAGILICALLFTVYAVLDANIGSAILLPLTGFSRVLQIPAWVYVPFTVFVFYAAANTVNFTDGVDGLAASVTMLVMAAFTLAAAIAAAMAAGAGAGGGGAGALSAAFAGGCLGFLYFNRYPAKVIMGDCGSLALGGAVAAAAVVMRAHWILLLFGVIYVAEGLSVVIQVSYFKRTRRRVFKMAPIHHHFELSGWSESRIVLTFCLVTFVFCCVGLWFLFGRVF